jgi:hypothetical protein
MGLGSAPVWLHGNAGDMFNADLLDMVYGTAHRIAHDGPRLLMVGSIAHRVQAGDVLCGVGTKGSALPSAPPVECEIVGVRGPITYEAFRAAGYDVSGIMFQYDPGLLISSMLSPEDLAVQAIPGTTIFIPHYRDDPSTWRHVSGPAVVSVDARPLDLARSILTAELVYSSSLHGIIFAHSLGRPCVPVAPASNEPLVKYRDYLASVERHTDHLPALGEALRAAKPTSPVDRSWHGFERAFPSLQRLARGNIYV